MGPHMTVPSLSNCRSQTVRYSPSHADARMYGRLCFACRARGSRRFCFDPFEGLFQPPDGFVCEPFGG